jgi:GTPase Era involved in 16S rRNA processing
LKDAGDNLKELKNKIPDIIPVSALNGDNLEALKLAVRNKLAEE